MVPLRLVKRCQSIMNYGITLEEGVSFFRDFILNIIKRKIECSGFPPTCTTDESKHFYVDELMEKSLVKTSIECIWSDPVGRYLNKIMANSVWGSGHKIHLVNKK